ncbi:methyltransferase [Amycolatopsis sp. NBC_00348]|uniref:methyltransferase n=1 Tax=Amycolatopsis sp. NBC_00348 TaxID=2975956 RepID=UPI002E254086
MLAWLPVPLLRNCLVIQRQRSLRTPSEDRNRLKRDDERTVDILVCCHRAMKPDGKLLLLERVVIGEPDLAFALSDLIMLVGTDGRERTDAGFCALLSRVGLCVNAFTPVLHGLHVIESVLAQEA